MKNNTETAKIIAIEIKKGVHPQTNNITKGVIIIAVKMFSDDIFTNSKIKNLSQKTTTAGLW